VEVEELDLGGSEDNAIDDDIDPEAVDEDPEALDSEDEDMLDESLQMAVSDTDSRFFPLSCRCWFLM
jgi:hypothetical protein